MGGSMMHDMMGGGMMWAMGFIGLLVIAALVLVIAAFIKYLLLPSLLLR
jgi:predicted RND superfamily exporter protein